MPLHIPTLALPLHFATLTLPLHAATASAPWLTMAVLKMLTLSEGQRTLGGWSTSPVRLKPAEQAPITFPEPNHLEPELQNRVPFENLEEGSVITGPITDVWLYHGIQVDFGASSDGLTLGRNEYVRVEHKAEPLLKASKWLLKVGKGRTGVTQCQLGQGS
eukprot:280840-Pelagomonas_calceolata.AAC.3